MKIAFTLCSNNYLAQAKTLGDSFINHNQDFQFIIGLVDRRSSQIDYDFFEPHKILEVESISIDDISELIDKYNIVEFNTAVKPFYFDYLFCVYDDASSITYIDPDIKVFGSLQDLDTIYEQADFVLTPHLLTLVKDSIPEKEQLVLNVGSYNLGFLGLKRSDQVIQFIEYFKHRMREKCYIDFCNGLFVDQIWANQIPSYFEKVYIWKDYGCNVGYWNFSERKVSQKEGKYFINHEYPLIFFHLSNYNPNEPNILCKFLSYSFEKRPDLRELYEDYRKDLLHNRFESLSGVKPSLPFKENHPHLNRKEISAWSKNGLRLRNLSNKLIFKIFGV